MFLRIYEVAVTAPRAIAAMLASIAAAGVPVAPPLAARLAPDGWRRAMPILVRTGAALTLSAAALTPASAGTLPADLGQRLAEAYIRPATAAFTARSIALQGRLAQWCAAGAPAGERGQVDAEFHALLDAWARVEFLRFGPLVQDNRFERIFFWPDPRGLVARQVGTALKAADAAALAPGALRPRSVAVQGLPAIEQLLFGDGAQAMGDGTPASRYRCDLAAATAANVRDIAAALQRDWSASGNTGADFAAPAAGNALYRSANEVAAEAFKALATGVKFLREAKLAPMMGATPAEARAQRGAFWRSNGTAHYLAAGARGLGDFYAAARLADSYAPAERSADESFLAEIGRVTSHLHAVAAMPLEAALTGTERRHVVLAQLMADNLRNMIDEVIAPAFGVTLGFNALDGD
jgi:predicted lipoprotein